MCHKQSIKEQEEDAFDGEDSEDSKRCGTNGFVGLYGQTQNPKNEGFSPAMITNTHKKTSWDLR